MSNKEPTGEHRERLLTALEAVRKAGNPLLARSILMALEGRPSTVEDAFPPEDFFRE